MSLLQQDVSLEFFSVFSLCFSRVSFGRKVGVLKSKGIFLGDAPECHLGDRTLREGIFL